MDDEKLRNKFLGALVGLAVGDAIGTTNEFGKQRPWPGHPVITDMTGKGPFHLMPGEWTDDTSMALCLAASLITQRKYDAADVLSRFVRWDKKGVASYMSVNARGRFDIGGTTSDGLYRFVASGGTRASAEGNPANGSIMRLAPVPMFFADDLRLTAIMSAQSSLTTHGSPACRFGCAYLGVLIARLLTENRTKLEVLYDSMKDPTWQHLPILSDTKEQTSHLEKLFSVIMDGSFLILLPEDVSQAGSVWATLEAALWTFVHTDNFRDGALMIANRGDDSDTVGAVFGQIAGAYYGLDGIPLDWVGKLAKGDLVIGMADALYHLYRGEGAMVPSGLIESIR